MRCSATVRSHLLGGPKMLLLSVQNHNSFDWRQLILVYLSACNCPSMDFCEFLAEEGLIEIIPTFKYPKQLNLISGDFGPFYPSIPTRVPIWLALNLHRQHKCSIIPPDWISSLSQLQDRQEKSTDLLIEMPTDSWREILKLLEHSHSNSINCSELIERREAILRMSAHNLFRVAQQKDTLFIGDVMLNNASRSELQLVKGIIQKSFAHLQELRKSVFDAANNKQ